MKSDKGVTLSSVIIYVIVLLVVIGTVSTLTGYLYKNTDELVVSNNSQTQYTRFIQYLTQDTNSTQISSVTTSSNDKNSVEILLNNGEVHQYIYSGREINYIITNIQGEIEKNITLCGNIDECEFEFSSNILNTTIKINDISYTNRFIIKV